MESNDSPEIPDSGETSDIPGLYSGQKETERTPNSILQSDFINNDRKEMKLKLRTEKRKHKIKQNKFIGRETLNR